jgi:hypothetical protein
LLIGVKAWGVGGVFSQAFYGGYEAIAAAGEGFDEAGAGGGVVEGFADAVDGGVDAVFGVDPGAVGPEVVGDLVAGEELARTFEEQAEDLEGLGVEAQADALAAELAGGDVGLEGSEAVAAGWCGAGHVW